MAAVTQLIRLSVRDAESTALDLESDGFEAWEYASHRTYGWPLNCFRVFDHPSGDVPHVQIVPIGLLGSLICWLVIASSCFLPRWAAAWVSDRLYEQRRQRERVFRSRGRCPACGYDLIPSPRPVIA